MAMPTRSAAKVREPVLSNSCMTVTSLVRRLIMRPTSISS